MACVHVGSVCAVCTNMRCTWCMLVFAGVYVRVEGFCGVCSVHVQYLVHAGVWCVLEVYAYVCAACAVYNAVCEVCGLCGIGDACY